MSTTIELLLMPFVITLRLICLFCLFLLGWVYNQITLRPITLSVALVLYVTWTSISYVTGVAL